MQQVSSADEKLLLQSTRSGKHGVPDQVGHARGTGDPAIGDDVRVEGRSGHLLEGKAQGFSRDLFCHGL
ncbi:hypothetical protein SDC9_192406 [bioreactor metagenome]|uniref:Uncharacterized protein n=1 Tax=bioreactor metagenome TaxID=1076179 RepID=A0A645I326_9ZZZZ